MKVGLDLTGEHTGGTGGSGNGGYQTPEEIAATVS